MYYTFIKEKDITSEYDRTRVEMSTETVNLTELLEDFEDFLRASGFVINGTLIIDKGE